MVQGGGVRLGEYFQKPHGKEKRNLMPCLCFFLGKKNLWPCQVGKEETGTGVCNASFAFWFCCRRFFFLFPVKICFFPF